MGAASRVRLGESQRRPRGAISQAFARGVPDYFLLDGSGLVEKNSSKVAQT